MSLRKLLLAAAILLSLQLARSADVSDATYFGEDETDLYFGDDDEAAAEVLRATYDDNIAYLSHPVEEDDDEDDGLTDEEEGELDVSNPDEGLNRYDVGMKASASAPGVAGNRVPAMVVMMTLDGALHALHAHTGRLLWSFSTGGKTINSSASFHGDMLFVSTLDGAGLMAYKPGYGMATIPKSIFQSTKPFTLRATPDVLAEDRCVTSKSTKLFRVDVGTGRARSVNHPAGEEKCDLRLEPILFVARTDFTISCLDSVDGTETWHYSTAEFDLSMNNSPDLNDDPLPREAGILLAVDPGDHPTQLQALQPDTETVRWAFTAPKPLLPSTLRTINPAGTLHMAEVREVMMDDNFGAITHHTIVAAAVAELPAHHLLSADVYLMMGGFVWAEHGAVVAYHAKEPTIKIRQSDNELFVVATHAGELFHSMESLYSSFNQHSKQSAKQRAVVKKAYDSNVVLHREQLDDCHSADLLVGDVHRECLVGNYPLQIEALAQLPPGASAQLLAGPEESFIGMAYINSSLHWLQAWSLWLCGALVSCLVVIYWQWKQKNDRRRRKKKRNKKAGTRRASREADQLFHSMDAVESEEASGRADSDGSAVALADQLDPSSLSDGVDQQTTFTDTFTDSSSAQWSDDDDNGTTVHLNDQSRSRSDGTDDRLPDLRSACSISDETESFITDTGSTPAPLTQENLLQLAQLVGPDNQGLLQILEAHHQAANNVSSGDSGSPNRTSIWTSRTASPLAIGSLSGSPSAPVSPIHSAPVSPIHSAMLQSTPVFHVRPSRYAEEYEELELLGKGSFGSVHRVQNRVDENEYAVKKVLIPEAKIDQVLAEVRIISRLDHPNVIRFYTSWIEDVDSDELPELNLTECSSEGESFTAEPSSPTHQPSSTWCWSGKGYKRGAAPDNGDNLFYHESPVLQSAKELALSLDSSACAQSLRAPLDSSRGEIIFTDEFSSKSRQQVLTQDVSYVPGDTAEGEKSASADEPKEANGKGRMKVLYISMQLCQTETLYDWLRVRNSRCENGQVDREECLVKLKQMVDGIEYVHSQQLIHRDLKPANIFISQSNVIKLGDFGLSRKIPKFLSDEEFCGHQSRGEMLPANGDDGDMTLGVGTPTYTSPEVLADTGGGGSYTAMADIFSLGIILVELYHPFSTAMERATVLSQAREGKVPDSLGQPQFALELNLGTNMLKRDPLQRQSAASISSMIGDHAPAAGNSKLTKSFSAPALFGAVPEIQDSATMVVVRTHSDKVQLPSQIAEVIQGWCTANEMPEPPGYQLNVEGEEMTVRFTLQLEDALDEMSSPLEEMFGQICEVHPSLSRNDISVETPC